MKLIMFNILLLMAVPFQKLNAVEVEVTITGLRNSKGAIVIGIFKDDPTFQKEEAYASRNFQKKDISNGTMKVTLTLEPGVWGLSVLDDENLSGLMEYNFIGMPKEGFGFSDYYLAGLSKPKFNDFKFSVEEGKNKKIVVKIRYI